MGSPARRSLILGVVASVALHLLAGVLARMTTPAAPALPEPDPLLMVDVDIHQAPEPPRAELAPESEPPAEEPPGAPEPESPESEDPDEPADKPADEPPDESGAAEAEVVPEGLALADAGLADASPADAMPADAGPADASLADASPADAMPADAMPADAGPADAGPADPSLLAGGEPADAAPADASLLAGGEPADAAPADASLLAGAEPADAGVSQNDAAMAVASPTSGDAGAEAASVDPAGDPAGDLRGDPAGDLSGDPAGDPADNPGDGTSGGAARDPSGSRVAAGTASLDLLAHLPPGDAVAVLIRLGRLRNTPWAARAEAIVAPMPDYRTLVGGRDTAITDLFDTLVISTPRPRDVTATTLVGRTALPGAELRAFLDHAAAPVRWSTARGGPLGRRQRSRLVHTGDQRVFLLPMPGWVVLTQPRHLGVLMEPRAGDIDQSVQATAAIADLPAWLARVRDIEATAGGDQGPVLAATIEGLLPPVQKVPFVGVLTMPGRVTATIDITQGGFFVRGVMRFDSAEAAASFAATMLAAQVDLAGSRLGKMFLDGFHAYHALRGLSFDREGARVAFATSISIADARGMLDVAARWSRDFFGHAGAAPAGAAPAGAAPAGAASGNSAPPAGPPQPVPGTGPKKHP